MSIVSTSPPPSAALGAQLLVLPEGCEPGAHLVSTAALLGCIALDGCGQQEAQLLAQLPARVLEELQVGGPVPGRPAARLPRMCILELGGQLTAANWAGSWVAAGSSA